LFRLVNLEDYLEDYLEDPLEDLLEDLLADLLADLLEEVEVSFAWRVHPTSYPPNRLGDEHG
jgi:hypothetical protein